jgi:hypothetical protein
MPVTDPTGFDWNSQFRMPQGWTTLPDGSVGPSSSLPDWLKQLIPSPGAATPNAPGLPSGAGPQGLMPGGGVMGRQAATPGAPSMGFPAQAGGGATSILSALAGGNPYARAMIAAGGVMTPSPAETGELPLSMSGARPMHPASTGAMPGPQPMQPGADGINPYAAAAAANPPQGGPYVGSGAPAPFRPPSRPYTPTPNPGPMDPSIIARQSPSAAMANAPPGNPSDTPRPGGTPYPPRRPKNLGAAPAAAPSSSGNKNFGLYQPQVPGSGQGGPLSRSPIYSTLNLFGARS